MSERDQTVHDAAERVAKLISEMCAVTSYRLAHSPLSAVTPEETAAYEKLKGALAELSGHAWDAGYRRAVAVYAQRRHPVRGEPTWQSGGWGEWLLVDEDGRVLGRVSRGGFLYTAYVEGGAALGGYIDEPSAKRAVQLSVGGHSTNTPAA